MQDRAEDRGDGDVARCGERVDADRETLCTERGKVSLSPNLSVWEQSTCLDLNQVHERVEVQAGDLASAVSECALLLGRALDPYALMLYAVDREQLSSVRNVLK